MTIQVMKEVKGSYGIRLTVKEGFLGDRQKVKSILREIAIFTDKNSYEFAFGTKLLSLVNILESRYPDINFFWER